MEFVSQDQENLQEKSETLNSNMTIEFRFVKFFFNNYYYIIKSLTLK